MNISKLPPRSDLFAMWTDALRSGNYQQGREQLKTLTLGRSQFCCVGVLCDLILEAQGGRWDTQRDEPAIQCPNDSLESLEMPYFLATHMNMTGDDLTNLYGMNDDEQLSFPSIAQYIERTIMPVALNASPRVIED